MCVKILKSVREGGYQNTCKIYDIETGVCEMLLKVFLLKRIYIFSTTVLMTDYNTNTFYNTPVLMTDSTRQVKSLKEALHWRKDIMNEMHGKI